MPDYTFPTADELREVAQEKTPRLIADRPIFQILPIETAEEDLLEWEQEDNYTGLQGVRGLNGLPSRVSRVGAKGYLMRPGYYGEFGVIDENELTRRRDYGTFGTPIDLSKLVMKIQDQLLVRRFDRIELIGWNLVANGTFSTTDKAGNVVHTDSFTLQTFTAGVTWATVATATPLADFRAIKLLGRGKGVTFGAGARVYMNQVTYNNMIANTNAADLYGRRTDGLSTVNNLGDFNRLLAGDDLAQIAIYDEGYLDDTGTFVPFIGNGKAIAIGKRTAGQVIGNYRMTRNANNANMAPGAYMKVIDRGEDQVPRQIEVHDGHNGGPVLYFPSAIIKMSV